MSLVGDNNLGVYNEVPQVGEPVSVTERLRRLQTAIEGDDRGATSRMARRLNVSAQRWGNVVNGYPLSLDLAMTITKNCPGVTLDWLYQGRTEGLSYKMAQSLEDIGRGCVRG
jgi:hypothetical protein